ncbi:E3 ubiquitin-protein ligase TRIP12-like, partial [Pollicipes pollicipes]|uniref:E3 ubiquitin-protein ligase TRIP12-like n=1 Tax=Pollicipes pollicipes TaxID=41117 RepID=UPI00188505A2
MTVFQAVEQFGQHATQAGPEQTVSATELFETTHTIHYRCADALWSAAAVPAPSCPLLPYLTARLPSTVTVDDPCLETLQLLRLLHALSRHYGTLYHMEHCPPLLSEQEFINSQLTAKASRQLRDPLILMTGSTPQWIQQIGLTCPFVFPFETRRLLFFTVALDRDRALLRLLE